MKKRRDFGNGLLRGGQLGHCLYNLQLPDWVHPTSPPSQGRELWPGTNAKPLVLPTHPFPSRRATRVRVVFVFVFCFVFLDCAITLLLFISFKVLFTEVNINIVMSVNIERSHNLLPSDSLDLLLN